MASAYLTEQQDRLLTESRSVRQRAAGMLNTVLREMDCCRWGPSRKAALTHERELLLAAIEALVAPGYRPPQPFDIDDLEENP